MSASASDIAGGLPGKPTGTIAGVILAGGLSRRMGGQEKSLMMLAGKSHLEHVRDRLAPQVTHLAINANGPGGRFDFLNLPVLPDPVPGFVGPLAGVLAGMRWAAGLEGVTHIVTAAADTPFFPTDYVARLCRAVMRDDDVVMPSSSGRIHPVFALWPVHLADALEHFLTVEDKRKILEFAERTQLHNVGFDTDGSGDPFFNINTPEDHQKAEAMAADLAGRKGLKDRS